MSRCVAVLALVLAVVGLSASTAAAAHPPVRLSVAFGHSARLGRHTPISLGLRIDPAQVPSPVTEVRILTPANLNITLSGLGIATCRRPPADFANVLLSGETVADCPANAMLATGTATADLRFSEEQTIKGSATIRLYAGARQRSGLGLVALVATANPVVTQLAYAGRLFTAARPFGLGMVIRIPAIPDPPLGATVALVRLRMALGGREIVYSEMVHGQRISYAPGAIPLPRRCPRGGFRFRALLRFADGSRRTSDAVVRCPPRSARRRRSAAS